MLLIEAFSCDQVSINPVTFTTWSTEAPLSLSVGHTVATHVKFKERGCFIACVTSFPTKHPQVGLPLILPSSVYLVPSFNF